MMGLCCGIYFLAAIGAATHALLTKPDSRSAAGWIAICWLVPFVGAAFYWLFGINRIRTRAKSLRMRVRAAKSSSAAATHDELTRQLTRIGDSVTQWQMVSGNSVQPLENGENAFPNMLASIAAAKHTVWLATYIFETDATGRQFIDALAAAAARGVQVRVLVDGVGEWYSWPHAVPLLRRAGVEAARFLPPRLLPPTLFLNLRNHRKLLLVDGHTGYIGGMNIGGREVGKGNRRRMRDLHFEVRGPVVRHFYEVFSADWLFAARRRLRIPQASGAVAESLCRVITDGPNDDIDKLIFVIIGALSVARRRILVMTPYFIPPPELTAALQSAALRGVEVILVLPERSNLRYVDWASRRWLPPLLERGVRIFLQPPPFSHSKLLVVDDEYAQIGSANLDPRSRRLNFEIVVEVVDGAICERLGRYIDDARQKSSPYTARSVAQRRITTRIRDSACWLLSPYL
jgi:cardiolipin synthase A/B